MKNKNFKEFFGFTLIELLVVISLIGLLASVVLVAVNNSRNKARYAQILTTTKQINKAKELYVLENGFYPTSMNSLVPNFLSAVPRPVCANWQTGGPKSYSLSVNGTTSSAETIIGISRCGFASCSLLFTSCGNESGYNCNWSPTGAYGFIEDYVPKEITCRE